MAAPRQPVLLGRAAERRALDGLLDDVRRGRSAVLVLHGEAGVGKTALLDACARQASRLRVARIAGVESEMELPFAALHQLCAPMLDHVDALPAPQRRALRVAFGLAFGGAPDRFLVALATLGLLAEVAAERPLLCVVDDAQWLDAASAQVLGFVARRLEAESVAIVLAVRGLPDRRELAGLPELAVRGLPHAEARALLESALPGRLDEGVRDRLVAETRGNPLALLELAREPAVGQVAGGFGLVAPQELSGRIEQRFRQRLEDLPEDARRLLLVAAAEPVGDPLLLWSAAERLGIRPASAGEAERLLAIGDRVTFLHPLVRSAVYRAAPPHERRAVHLALADVTASRVEADRRAWHLAAAAPGPDEAVARELERSAGRAQARGGFAAAAAFLQRSVALTRDPARRTERALAAAQASLHAGAFGAALEALATAEGAPLDELQGARVDLLRGQVALAAGSAARASPLLLKAARRLEPLDLALARETYLSACGAAMLAGPAGAGDLVRMGEAVRALPPLGADARAVDRLLDGLALLVTEGRGAAASALQPAARAFAGAGATLEESLGWGWMATAASNALWDDDGLRAVCGHQIRLARDAGALEPLPIHLIALATASARGGDFAAAASLVAEADAVTEATGTRLAPYAAELLLAALRGREAELGALEQAAIEQAKRSGQGIAATVADWASATLHNGLGRFEAALEPLRGRPRPRATCSRPCGPCPSWSRRPRAPARVTSRRTRSSGSWRRRGPPARTSASASRRGPARCWRRAPPPSPCTARRSSACAAPGCAPSSPVRTCSTASGCAAPAAGAPRASSCAPRRSCSAGWRWRGSPSAPAGSGSPRARRSAGGPRRRATRSRPRRRRSPGWPATASRTPRSGRGCSSAPARSSGTSRRCSRSSGSPRAGGCATRCRAPTATPRPRSRRAAPARRGPPRVTSARPLRA
jgi:AAA ATPase domain